MSVPTPATPTAGALVISLDFELHWGVRDHVGAGDGYMQNVLGARNAIPRILRLFSQFDVAATWATVGMLFADTREELEAFKPAVLPVYPTATDNPYREPVGKTEADDPCHFGWALIRQINEAPHQEIGSHTFSHYYCLQAGSSAEAFRADLDCSMRIAEYRGIQLRSLVLPRNQVNPDYLPVIRDAGFSVYRDNPVDRLNKARGGASPPHVRALRLLDNYVSVVPGTLGSWSEPQVIQGVRNVPATRFLRPYSPSRAALDGLRIRRMCGGLEEAAKTNRIYHLWWHPHNFGRDLERNLTILRRVLERYRNLREAHGMVSLTMAGAADLMHVAS